MSDTSVYTTRPFWQTESAAEVQIWDERLGCNLIAQSKWHFLEFLPNLSAVKLETND